MAKRFKRRLDTPAKLIRIEGLGDIPLNPDGTVVYGTYVIRYIWSYDNITVVKPRTLVFSPPDNRIEFRKNGFTINKVEKINIISSQSTDPYHPTYFSTINTSLPSDITAHYVERDINDAITLDVDITNDVTINTTLVQSSVVSNKLPQGTYVFSYQAEYNNGSTTYTKSISREIVSTTYTTVPQQNPPLYTLVWENLPLPVINKDVGDAFPSLAEMTDIIPTAVITETATGNVTRFATTYLTPTEPAGGVTTSSTYLIKFMAVNLLSGSGGDTGFDDVTFNTYVVPQLKTRSIQYNIVTQNPQPVPIEITFSPATLDDVTFQDFESGSNPVPLSYNNGGLFPSEAQLLSGVTATYVDEDSIVQPLSITITRPTGSQYTNPLKDFFFDNGEVKMHIPRTWAVKYEATAPDGTYKSITRNVIIEDTIAPVFSPVVPTTMEKGTGYNTWLGRTFYGYDYPRYSDTYPAPRSGTTITVDKTQQEFNALDDGDTFTTTYTTIDNSGNARITAQVTTCQDTVSPTLTFNSTLTFPTGSNPTDEELKVGVETSDLSEPITLTVDDSGINYSVQGFYTASYTATDAYGNSRTRTRNVFVKGAGPTLTPPGPSPIACPTTPGVPNIFLDGTEVIANLPDSFWLEDLYASLEGENITYKIVISQASIDALPVTAAGTLDWDNNSDGWIDVEVTPLYINYEIQDEDGVPLICTTRYIETIDVLAPTIYNIPNPILVYKAPNDGFGQSSTTPNDVIADIVSQINVIDNVDGTGFTTATLEGITQVDINSGSDIVRTLRFTDSEGNESRYVTTIQFTDNAHPVITLLGDDPLILTSSVLPSDPGATATDLEDGTLPVTSYWNSIFPNGKAIYGTWNVKYTATDSAGVIVEEIREVQVPYFPPTITLLGNNPYSFTQNPGYQSDPLAEAYSVLDGNLTSQITSNWDDFINGSTQEDTYIITYSVTDSRGATVTATRTVNYNSCPYKTLPSLYFDGSSTKALNSTNTIALGGATLNTSDGKYGSDSFNFGASGNKQPILIGTDIILSTGVYTFSLWFYNKRGGSDWASVLRQTSGGNPNNTANYPIAIRNTDNYLGLTKREGSSNNFYSTGYDMSSFEGDTSWNHLVVVADGTNSTFYVNGQQAGSVIAKVITTSVGELNSYDGNDTQTFAEGIDEFAYWDVALDPCEIEQIYNSSVDLKRSHLVQFEESRFITLYGDASLNNGILELDGTGDYAIYDGDFRFTDQISVSVWFKTSDSGDQRIVSCHVRDAGNNGFFIRLEGGSLRVRHPDGGVAENTVAGSWNDGNWHHVVITWQANITAGKKIYVDGIEEFSSISGLANGYNSSYDLHIGANPWSGNPPYANFQGQIDDLRVVRKVMNSTEVREIYLEKCYNTTVSDYWDGSSTTAQTGSGTLNIRGGTADIAGGKYSPAFNFSSTENAAITPSSAFDFSGDATLAFWMKDPDTTKVSSTGTNDDYWWQILRSDQSSDNYAAFMFDNRSPTGTGNTQGSLTFLYNSSQAQHINYNISSLQDGEWHHIAFVKSGTSIDIYVDNVVVGTATNVPTGILFDQVNGWSGTTVRSKFANYISDLAYWDSALEACEIFKLYTATANIDGKDGLEEYSTLNSGATLTDGVLELDGLDDYASITNEDSLDRGSEDMTVHFWFNADVLPSSNNNFRLVTKLNPWDGWMINLSTQNDDNANAMTNGGIAVYQSSTGAGSNRNNRKAPVGGVTLNTWHHVAVVFTSSGDNKIYYDGSLLHSFTPVSRTTTTTEDLRIGASRGNSAIEKFFDGELDKVKIEKTILTAPQILNIYNSGR